MNNFSDIFSNKQCILLEILNLKKFPYPIHHANISYLFWTAIPGAGNVLFNWIFESILIKSRATCEEKLKPKYLQSFYLTYYITDHNSSRNGTVFAEKSKQICCFSIFHDSPRSILSTGIEIKNDSSLENILTSAL